MLLPKFEIPQVVLPAFVRYLTLILIFASLTPVTQGALAQSDTNEVNQVRFWHSPSRTRVVFDVSENIKHNVFSLKDPDRLVVDIHNGGLKATLPIIPVDNARLAGVRSGSPSTGVLRFVFELRRPLEAHSFVLTPNELYGHRLVLDLLDLQPEDEMVDSNQEKLVSVKNELSKQVTPVDSDRKLTDRPLQEQTDNGSAENLEVSAADKKIAPEFKTPSEAPKADKQVAQKSAAKPEVISVKAEPSKQKTVIAIDAGHGGEDPGALGHRGGREKKITLAIAKRLKKVIDGDDRMTAFLVREGDYYIDLTRRRIMAKEKGADIFVSIHADAFTHKSANGLSVFALSQRGATSAMAKALAEKENASDLIGGVSLANKDPILAKVLVDLSMTNTISESVNLGGRVLKELAKVGRLHSKRVEQASFVVLKSPDIPSILIETGFITNPEEEKKLRSKSYQKKIANAIHRALGEYVEQTPYYNKANYSSPNIATLKSSGDKSKPVQNHTVKRGDSLSSIALRYGTTVAELKRVNGLKSNVAVLGKKLKVPRKRQSQRHAKSINTGPFIHIVKRGESLSKISLRYNVTIRAIKRLNGLTKNSVYQGQKLKIPGDLKVPVNRPAKHKVTRGDTLSEIAQRYGVTTDAIVNLNGLGSDTVRLGQTLKIPQ